MDNKLEKLSTINGLKNFLDSYHQELVKTRKFPPLGIQKALHSASIALGEPSWNHLSAELTKQKPAEEKDINEDSLFLGNIKIYSDNNGFTYEKTGSIYSKWSKCTIDTINIFNTIVNEKHLLKQTIFQSNGPDVSFVGAEILRLNNDLGFNLLIYKTKNNAFVCVQERNNNAISSGGSGGPAQWEKVSNVGEIIRFFGYGEAAKRLYEALGIDCTNSID